MKTIYANLSIGLGVIICCIASYGMFVTLIKDDIISYYLSSLNPFYGVGYALCNIF